jgi:HSP20 family protein
MNTQELSGHESAAELSDWPGSPLSTLHPMADASQPIPFEEFAENNRYVVRIELPGVDPGQDVDISIDAHVLTVRAERPAGAAGQHRSALPFGTFRCQITLPAATNDRDAAATYRNGILEISVGWQEGPTARKIEVLALANPR